MCYWFDVMECTRLQVTTGDGYILSMQRIPVGLSGGTPGKRVPVLLQHGLLMVSNSALMLELNSCS